jgi:hypothetical protein
VLELRAARQVGLLLGGDEQLLGRGLVDQARLLRGGERVDDRLPRSPSRFWRSSSVYFAASAVDAAAWAVLLATAAALSLG